MKESYIELRLTKSNQAPLGSVRPFIYYIEMAYGARFDEEELLETVFKKYRDKFAPMSGQRETLGFYQLRSQ
jgi:hypothetical protein